MRLSLLRVRHRLGVEAWQALGQAPFVLAHFSGACHRILGLRGFGWHAGERVTCFYMRKAIGLGSFRLVSGLRMAIVIHVQHSVNV